jgi:RNA polymerase sigma-70 factor, ECF subfamily
MLCLAGNTGRELRLEDRLGPQIEHRYGTYYLGNRPSLKRRPNPRQAAPCRQPARVKSRMAAVQGDATDEMLMVRYQRGERAAFAELVRRHSRPIYNFVLRQLRVPSVAEDVTQDVFMRLVQNAADFKHEARFLTWLYTIARNLCIDQLRKISHRRHASLDQPGGDNQDGKTLLDFISDPNPQNSAERTVLSAEVRSSIVKAVDALPDDQREVFLLREVANLPFRDIAEITGVGENTVKSRMRYALDRLKEALCDFEEYARALR